MSSNGQPSSGWQYAKDFISGSGNSPDEVVCRLSQFHVEVPSWGFSRGGTRFGVYRDGSEAVTIEEKISDAALVHRLTAATPTIALHFPWDAANSDELNRLEKALDREEMKAGAINSNTFSIRAEGPMDHRLRLGSLTNPFPEVRKATVQHHFDCIDIMRRFGSKLLSVWLQDGSNSPGQCSFFEQAEYLIEGLRQIYDALSTDEWMLLEYKLFEPGFYSTAIADWGKAYSICQSLGPRALVLVDLGHHPLGANIEQIVSDLARLRRLGGFHFNDKKYADDDLAAGTIDPYQLFRIFLTLREAHDRGHLNFDNLAFMIDQSHMIKHPVEEMLETVDSLQRAYAQALIVDQNTLRGARNAGDVSAADRALSRAFRDAPVTALLAEVRQQKGVAADPPQEFRQMRAEQKIRSSRTIAHCASTGLGS